jgi:hypothetical protein
MTAGKDRQLSPTHTMIIEVQSTVDINDVETEVFFQFDYIPVDRGSHDHYGQQNEPDVESRMEFYTAIDSDGMEVDVLPRHIEAATELAWQQVSEN